MSVTFWCPDAPKTRQIPYPDQDPTFEIDVSDLPEINLANSNARAALEMLGIQENEDLMGVIKPEQFDGLIARLRSFLGCSVERASLLEPTTVNGMVVVDAVARHPERELAMVLDLEAAPQPQYDHESHYPSVDSPGAMTLGQLLGMKLGANPLLPAPNQTAEMVLAEPTRRKGPTIYSMGRSDEYLRDVASRFIDLFTQAQEHNYEVVFA